MTLPKKYKLKNAILAGLMLFFTVILIFFIKQFYEIGQNIDGEHNYLKKLSNLMKLKYIDSSMLKYYSPQINLLILMTSGLIILINSIVISHKPKVNAIIFILVTAVVFLISFYSLAWFFLNIFPKPFPP